MENRFDAEAFKPLLAPSRAPHESADRAASASGLLATPPSREDCSIQNAEWKAISLTADDVAVIDLHQQ